MSENKLGRWNDYDNVHDFVEYKLHKSLEKWAEEGREDIAEDILMILQRYLAGEINVWFQGGQIYYDYVAQPQASENKEE